MRKRLIPGALFVLFSTLLNSQAVVDRPIVWQVPTMASITKQDYSVNYQGDTLEFICYQPLGFEPGQSYPTIVFANGGIEKLPHWRVYQDWAKLMASQGFVAILHFSTWQNRFQRLGQMLDYCHEEGASIGVDGQKIGVWACSGNVTAAFPRLMDKRRSYLKAASLYYGMPSQIERIRQDLPLQIVRAGLDMYSLNHKIDQFIQQALKVDIPLDFINYLEGYHAFDVLNDTPRSRQIIQQTVQFFQHHLSTKERHPDQLLTATNFYEMIIRGEWNAAANMMKAALAADQAEGRPYRGYYRVADENNINWTGYQLIREGRTREAVFVMQLNKSLFPASVNTYDSLADAYEANKEPAKALQWARKTLQLVEENQDLPAQQRKLLKESAEDKIKRLLRR